MPAEYLGHTVEWKVRTQSFGAGDKDMVVKRRDSGGKEVQGKHPGAEQGDEKET